MAENSENQNLSVEDGEGGGVSGMEHGEKHESNLDPGFSPGVNTSSVGSTEGGEGGSEGILVDSGESDQSSAVAIQITADMDEDKSSADNFSTVAQLGSVDRESSISPADFTDVKEQVDDDFVDAPDQLSLMSDTRSVTGESIHYVEPREESDENDDNHVVEDGKQVRQLTYELALCQASLEKTMEDNEIIAQKHKEEREMLGRELANLQRQLEMMSYKQYSRTDNDNVLVDHLPREENQYVEDETHASDTSLQLMIANCFKSLGVLQKNFEDQLQSEGTARELHATLLTKDQEIENLSAKVDEHSVSHDVIASYMESLRQTVSQSLQESYAGQMERDLHLNDIMNKLLASLASVVQQKEFSEESSVEKISLLEKSTSLMIENYNRFLYEISLLKQCLVEVGKDVKMPEDTEYGIVFDVVRRELLEHKRMEDDIIEKLNQVENENKKLLEQLDQANARIEVADAEVGKLQTDLEQEKTKVANTKDKLGMAVTRGKALVQQRDSLKQTLAEKANELEKCLLELQEKSNALESAEIRNEELVQSKSLVETLQESLSKKATTLEEIEKILYQSDMTDELHSVDIIERVRLLVNQKMDLMDVSLEYNKLKSLLTSFNLPKGVASSNLDAQLSWLWESHCDAENNITTLQGEVISSKVAVASLESVLAEAFNEMDQLRTSLSIEKKERDSLEMGLQDLSSKYEAVAEREFQATSAKGRMTKMILEACGVEDQGELGELYSDMGAFVDMCIGKIKEQSITTPVESSYIGTEQFERIQSYLYVRDQELVLCEAVLEEERMKSSEMAAVANELKRASEEIMTLKGEKDSLERNLERSDEKYSQLREKLSMAVKKGKGLFQEREGIKKSLDEKNREIEHLKLELQQQESVLSGCRDEIKRLISDLERFSKVEADLFALKDENNQLEKYLLQSNSMLERVVESMDSVVVPVDTVLEEPMDKVKWLTDSLNEYRIGKVNADKDLEKVKEEANSLSEKLTEAHTIIRSLETALSEMENGKILLAEEMEALQTSKAHLEQELEQAKEEARSLSSKFAEASTNIDALEDALSRAEKNTSLLEEEKAAATLSKNIAEKELEKVKEETEFQARKLVEAYTTIKSLEEGLSQLEKSLSVLTEEKNAAQAGMASLEKDFEKFQGEAGSQASNLAGLNATVKSLEDALSMAENNITVLTDSLSRAEKSTSILEEEKVAAEQELKRAKEEAELQANKLVEAYRTIKSLEEGLSQMEKNVSVLIEEKNAAQAGMASLESDLEKSRDEAGSQASKLADVYATVKSLEDALSAAEENISVLTKKNKNAEMEVQTLNDKLSASMAELAGVQGSSGSQSMDLFSHLSRLQMIMNDNNLLSSLTKDFKKKFERLSDMNLLLDIIRDQFVERGSDQLQTNANTERDSYAVKMFSASIDTFLNGEVDSLETNEDVDDVMSYIAKIIEGFNKKNKLLEDKFEYFSSSMDELIVFLLRSLQATKDNVIDMLEHMEKLKLDVRNLGAYKQAAESSTFALKNDLKVLLSSWSDTARDLGFQMDNSLTNLRSNQELGNLDNGLHLRTRESSEDGSEQQRESVGGNDYVESAQSLINEIRSQIISLENVKNFTLTVIEEHQNKQKDSQVASENAMQERDLYQNRISTLESDLNALQNLSNEMKIKLKDNDATEDMLKEKDAELTLLNQSLATKEQESKGYFLSEDQVKTFFEKIDQIEILPEETDLDISDSHHSGPLEKLFDVIGNITQLQHRMRLLSHDKEELQASLAVQVDETERLKKEMKNLVSINQNLGETRNDLAEFTKDLKMLIQKVGGNDLIENNKFDVKGLLTTLDNLVMASIRECETSKAKAQESGVKLHENQKFVVELSEKVKLLEDSIHSRPALSDPVQERSIFKESLLPTGSEISEIEDGAPSGRNSMSPVLPAAHVRTLRKGSSDHLAITIDSESERLINRHEIDDDKGHMFKSLNTSGLIPKQGKLMADRLDGIWVSGGRILMSRPRARIGVIAYCLIMHLWILGTIL